MKEEITHMYDCVQMTQIEKGQKEGIKKEINIEGKNKGKTINNTRVMNHLIYSFFSNYAGVETFISSLQQ